MKINQVCWDHRARILSIVTDEIAVSAYFELRPARKHKRENWKNIRSILSRYPHLIATTNKLPFKSLNKLIEDIAIKWKPDCNMSLDRGSKFWLDTIKEKKETTKD